MSLNTGNVSIARARKAVGEMKKLTDLTVAPSSSQAAVMSKKKKYRNLNDRVQRTVNAYGQSEVLLYLRAIAHLSHV